MGKIKKEKTALLKKNITVPLYMIFIIILITGTFFFLLMKDSLGGGEKQEESGIRDEEYNVRRLGGYKFIKPLLAAKPAEESDLYADLKNDITELIRNYTYNGTLSAASVYLRDFEKGDWFSAFGLEKFNSGSILKVPVLITFLKMEEEKPGTLNKKITFERKINSGIKQSIVSKGIELGKTYTVKQLLEYMIVYSDNDANLLLNENMDSDTFLRLFSDLNLRQPERNGLVYSITARECSRFLEVLFNATYLTPENSEYAMELLTRAVFNDGIQKGIPDTNLLIAHKFGESGDNINRQLHETAVFYLKNKPYLLTIMTRGGNNVEIEKLSDVLKSVANLVYKKLSGIES